ncbi:MAG: carboxypeptidase-like regulatory domain-containing protein [Planctomycetota bacterium]
MTSEPLERATAAIESRRTTSAQASVPDEHGLVLRLIDQDGQPLAGVEVRALCGADSASGMPTPLAKRVSGANGICRWRFDRSGVASVQVTATAVGLPPISTRVALDREAGVTREELELADRSALAGRLVLESGAPYCGPAFFECERLDFEEEIRAEASSKGSFRSLRSWSNEEGIFWLPLPWSTGTYRFTPRALGVGGAEPFVLESHEGAHDVGTLVVLDRLSIRGQVVDSNRVPVNLPGIRVSCLPIDEGRDLSLYVQQADTDDQGRFSLKGVAPGSYRLISSGSIFGLSGGEGVVVEAGAEGVELVAAACHFVLSARDARGRQVPFTRYSIEPFPKDPDGGAGGSGFPSPKLEHPLIVRPDETLLVRVRSVDGRDFFGVTPEVEEGATVELPLYQELEGCGSVDFIFKRARRLPAEIRVGIATAPEGSAATRLRFLMDVGIHARQRLGGLLPAEYLFELSPGVRASRSARLIAFPAQLGPIEVRAGEVTQVIVEPELRAGLQIRMRGARGGQFSLWKLTGGEPSPVVLSAYRLRSSAGGDDHGRHADWRRFEPRETINDLPGFEGGSYEVRVQIGVGPVQAHPVELVVGRLTEIRIDNL